MPFPGSARARRLVPGLVALTAIAVIHVGHAQSPAPRRDLMPAGAVVVESRGIDTSRGGQDVGVIVQLEGESVASRFAGRGRGREQGARLNARSVEARQHAAALADRQVVFERAVLASVPRARVGHRLQAVLNAVTLTVPSDAVETLGTLPGVRAVYPDNLQQPQTLTSPAFIGAPAVWSQLGGQSNAGSGVVIGVIDTGIWPEHPSLADPDGAGPYGPVAGWNGAPCEFGSAHPDDPPFTCNNKLLGARRVMATYDTLQTLQAAEFASARDDYGHGTHQATIAAGSGGVSASVVGNALGTVTGVAPRASLAAYKVCGTGGCYDSDVAAAVEQAVLDGVDVLNIALSGGTNPYNDAVSLALLDAYAAGVFVVGAAGNNGLAGVARQDPWTMTAGATTLNRAFTSTLTLRAGPKNLTVTGVSLTLGITTPTSVVNAADSGDAYCAASTPAGTFAGKVVVCLRGGNTRQEKSRNVMLRGGVGMILINPSTAGQSADSHFVPTVHLEKPASDSLLAFLAANNNETAQFTTGTSTTATGDVYAEFTSRSAGNQALGISKPDVVAPGVAIVAGMTPRPKSAVLGPPDQQFVAIEGTSIASAHLAGAGALLKALNPTWTPAHIRSALMLSARTQVVKSDATAANAFEMGSGRVNLQTAARPGLAMTAPAADFTTLQSRLWEVNYPSLYLPVMPGIQTVRRTIENLDTTPATWTIQAFTPSDVTVTVPASITLGAGATTSIDITVNAALPKVNHIRQAWLVFRESGGTRVLTFPISLVRMQNSVPIQTLCTPMSFKRNTTTTCSVTVTNSGATPADVILFDTLPPALPLVAGSVTDGTQTGNSVVWQGSLSPAIPGTIDVRPGPENDGFLYLSSYYSPLSCQGSCDDRVFTGAVPSGIRYNGAVYTQVSFSTNGVVQLGGDAPTSPVNLQFPNPAAPHNVLAPFWTDLHPEGTDGLGSGKLYIGYIALPSGRTWLVIEWADVVDKGGTAKQWFQVWLRTGGVVDEITYSYAKVSSLGAGGLLTVGAEDATGTSGDTYYYNGVGIPPAAGTATDLIVASPGPSPGGSHTISFRATGATVGSWTHCGVAVLSGSSEYPTSCLTLTVKP